jgi:hypothetical protein
MKKLCETILLNSRSGFIRLNNEGPKLTAGLKTPPDISPTEKAPTATVNPIASP